MLRVRRLDLLTDDIKEKFYRVTDFYKTVKGLGSVNTKLFSVDRERTFGTETISLDRNRGGNCDLSRYSVQRHIAGHANVKSTVFHLAADVGAFESDVGVFRGLQ